jgi:hypothetical protein
VGGKEGTSGLGTGSMVEERSRAGTQMQKIGLCHHDISSPICTLEHSSLELNGPNLMRGEFFLAVTKQ